MNDVTTEATKRTRKPRDPNAPKIERKPRPLGIVLAVTETGDPVVIKAGRDFFELMELMENTAAAGTFQKVTLKRLSLD